MTTVRGKIADLITLSDSEDAIIVELYHCKKTKEAPGARVDDIYDVCGQVVKSIKSVETPSRLFARIKEREVKNADFRYERGSRSVLDNLVVQSNYKPMIFRINLVQPGIAKSKISPEMLEILASARNYIMQNNCEEMRVLCSG